MESKKLHVLENPILHGKPAGDTPVHVIWDEGEWASFVIRDDGSLIIHEWGEWIRNGTNAPYQVQRIACALGMGMHLKVWVETVETHENDNFSNTQQPGEGWDANGYTETSGTASDFALPASLTVSRSEPMELEAPADEVPLEVIRVEEVPDDRPSTEGEYVEPDDQKTQTIKLNSELLPDELKSLYSSAVSIEDTTPVLRIPDDVPPPRKLLDYGTLNMPLVVSPDNGFFDGQPTVAPTIKKINDLGFRPTRDDPTFKSVPMPDLKEIFSSFEAPSGDKKES